MKGVVDERLERFGRWEQTGTRIERSRVARQVPGYTAADGRRRFRELAARGRRAGGSLWSWTRCGPKARTFIPWWRGVSEYENYFDKPAEMYAEMFGAFLADPDAVNGPCATNVSGVRGGGCLRVRQCKKMYNEFQAEKHTGQRNARHVANLRGEWERQAQDDLRRVTDALKKPSRMEKVMALRYGLDRRLGPYETAINRAYKALIGVRRK